MQSESNKKKLVQSENIKYDNGFQFHTVTRLGKLNFNTQIFNLKSGMIS